MIESGKPTLYDMLRALLDDRLPKNVDLTEGVIVHEVAKLLAPIPMILQCPMCHTRHIDEGAFATKPHHTHSCQNCGLSFRIAVPHTVGVKFLPGFKDGERAEGPPRDIPDPAPNPRPSDGFFAKGEWNEPNIIDTRKLKDYAFESKGRSLQITIQEAYCIADELDSLRKVEKVLKNFAQGVRELSKVFPPEPEEED